jgi:hypothetical protein
MPAEKKPHPLPNTVMSLPDKWIVFLGRPLRGHHHDDTRWQQALPPELDGLTDSHIRVDGGYLGMQAD